MGASSTSNINIVIKEDGSRVVKRNLDDLGTSADTTNKAIETLKGTLEAIVAAESIRAILEMVNQYQELHNQLIFVTTDQGNLNAVFEKLTEVAAATHTSVASNVQEFSALSQATHDLGLSQKEVIDFQIRLNEAVGLSGAGSKDAAGAVDLLAKSLATGRLEGGGFARSLQQVPVVGDILAKSLGVTRGQLKDMADTGQLSAKQLIDAFSKVGPALDNQFKGLAPTINETFGELKDSLTNAVGTFSDATGGGAALANAIRGLADFVKQATPFVIQFANAITGNLSPTDQLNTGMKVFASILVVLIGSLKLVGNILYTSVVGGFNAVGTVIGGLGASIAAWAEGVIDSFKAVIAGVAAIPEAIKQASAGNFAEAGKTIADAFSKPWDDAGKDFKRSSDTFNNTFVDLANNIGKTVTTEFDDVVSANKDMWTKLDKIWDQGARDLQKKKVPGGTISAKSGPNLTTQFSAQEIAATRKALADLLAQFDPIGAAVIKLKDAETLLDKAQREGIITKQQEAQYLTLLGKHYADILDPVGAYSRKIDEQTGLLKFSSDQREIESVLLAQTQQWQKQGIVFTQTEIDGLRSKLQAQQDLNKVVTEQDSLLADSVQKRQQFTNQLTAIQNLLANPKSGFSKGDAANAVVNTNSDLFANTTEQFTAQAAKYQTLYSQIDALRQKDLISEQTASAMKLRVWNQQQATQLSSASQFFGSLAVLQKSQNTKIAAVGKAAAISQALINTYQAATAAYAAMASIPYVGPALGAAAAAAAVVAGLANVAQIRSQPTTFMTGGSFTVPGGTGGPDSQMVSFRATPGERVSVATPSQVRKGDPNSAPGANGAAATPLNLRVVNVLDPGIVADYLATPEGEQVVMNLLHRNSDTVKSIATA